MQRWTVTLNHSILLYQLFSRVTRTLTIIFNKTIKNSPFIDYEEMSGVFICGPLFDLPVSTELLNGTSQRNFSTNPRNGILNKPRYLTLQLDRFIKQREHFFVVRDYYYAFLPFSLLLYHFQ